MELGFLQPKKKKCEKSDLLAEKSVKKVTYLLKIFNFGTSKIMKACLVIMFLGTFLPGH